MFKRWGGVELLGYADGSNVELDPADDTELQMFSLFRDFSKRPDIFLCFHVSSCGNHDGCLLFEAFEQSWCMFAPFCLHHSPMTRCVLENMSKNSFGMPSSRSMFQPPQESGLKLRPMGIFAKTTSNVTNKTPAVRHHDLRSHNPGEGVGP